MAKAKKVQRKRPTFVALFTDAAGNDIRRRVPTPKVKRAIGRPRITIAYACLLAFMRSSPPEFQGGPGRSSGQGALRAALLRLGPVTYWRDDFSRRFWNNDAALRKAIGDASRRYKRDRLFRAKVDQLERTWFARHGTALEKSSEAEYLRLARSNFIGFHKAVVMPLAIGMASSKRTDSIVNLFHKIN